MKIGRDGPSCARVPTATSRADRENAPRVFALVPREQVARKVPLTRSSKSDRPKYKYRAFDPSDQILAGALAVMMPAPV